jgi:hypothetical protein
MTDKPNVEGTTPDQQRVLKYWIDRCLQLEDENEELRHRLASFGIYIKPRPFR